MFNKRCLPWGWCLFYFIFVFLYSPFNHILLPLQNALC
nr:MAG TPA: hypothetical protein [Caudoviricetes sp.]